MRLEPVSDPNRLLRIQMGSVANRDPGSGASLTPDPISGVGKKSRSGAGIPIRDKHPESYSRELRNNFLGLKTLQFFYADPESF